MLCRHDFTLVSNLSPSMLWMLCPHDFTFVSHLSPLVLCPHDLHWPPTGLRLYPNCLPLDSGCSAPMILHLSPTCLRLSPTCLSTLWMLCRHDFTLVSNLSPSMLWMLCPHDFTFISHLSPLVLCPHDLHWPPTGLRLYPTCLPLDSGCFAHMILHLSPTCLCLSQCTLDALSAGPHDFALVSHSSNYSLGSLPA